MGYFRIFFDFVQLLGYIQFHFLPDGYFALEELWYVNQHCQDYHWDDVFEESPLARLGTVDGLAVVDGIVNGNVPEE